MPNLQPDCPVSFPPTSNDISFVPKLTKHHRSLNLTSLVDHYVDHGRSPSTCFYANVQFAHKKKNAEKIGKKNPSRYRKKVFTLGEGGKVIDKA